MSGLITVQSTRSTFMYKSYQVNIHNATLIDAEDTSRAKRGEACFCTLGQVTRKSLKNPKEDDTVGSKLAPGV